MYNRIKELPFYNTNSLSFGNFLKKIAYKIMQKSKKERVQHLFSESDIEILRNLGKKDTIHITRPDKGRGIVILNKADYINKLENLLSDHALFENQPFDDPLLRTLRLECKINMKL